MYFKLKNIIIIVITCLLLSAGIVYFIGTKDLEATKKAFTNLPALQVGDVLLRRGIGIDSYIIVKATDSKYSHVAMIASVNPLRVIHATTDDVDETKNMVIEQSLEEFLDNAKEIAVMRYSINSDDKNKIAHYLQEKLGAPFILKGEEGDYYCSTLVYEALSRVQDMTQLKAVFIDSAFIEGTFLLPDSFYHDKRASLIYAK